MLARAHKKFQRGQHSEIYLLTLKEQDKTKMELSHDIVSISASICRTTSIQMRSGFSVPHSGFSVPALRVVALWVLVLPNAHTEKRLVIETVHMKGYFVV